MGIKKYKISGRQTDIHTAQPLVLDYKLKYDHSNIKMCNESEYKGYERNILILSMIIFLCIYTCQHYYINCWNKIFRLHIQIVVMIFVSATKKRDANRNLKLYIYTG
jgi:hypothetical protein